MSLYINGQWMPGQGETITKTDPVSAALIWQANSANQADVEQACQAAQQAFEGWAALGLLPVWQSSVVSQSNWNLIVMHWRP